VDITYFGETDLAVSKIELVARNMGYTALNKLYKKEALILAYCCLSYNSMGIPM